MRSADYPKEAFGQRLGRLLAKTGHSRDWLAAELHFSYPTISAWINGAKLPDYDTVIALARLFHTSTDYLLTGYDAQVEEPARQMGLSQDAVDALSVLATCDEAPDFADYLATSSTRLPGGRSAGLSDVLRDAREAIRFRARYQAQQDAHRRDPDAPDPFDVRLPDGTVVDYLRLAELSELEAGQIVSGLVHDYVMRAVRSARHPKSE